MKKSQKFINTLLLIITAIFFVAGCICVFILPYVTNWLIDIPDYVGDRGSITQDGRLFVHIIAYVILLFALFADFLLMKFFKIVRKGKLFTRNSVSIIKWIFICCFVVGLAFISLGLYFQMAYIVGAASLILGICLIVAKYAIEEATAIKSENELTV